MRMRLHIVQCGLFIVYISTLVAGSLVNQLRSYETLSFNDLKPKRVRRSVGDSHVNIEELNFKGLNKQFHMFLRQRTVLPVLLPGFEVVTVDGNGKETPFSVDMSGFYEGKLSDDESSTVEAQFENGTLTATIDSGNETYIIEPAKPYLPEAANNTLILYKGSDLQIKKKSSCKFVQAGNNDERPANVSEEKIETELPQKTRRTKRSADLRNTCPLLLMADYRFFQKVALNDQAKAARKLIALIDRINSIYRRSKFTDAKQNTLTGYGFGIKRILVFTACTKHDDKHFNKCLPDTPDVWQDRMLLSAFDRGDYSDYCLAHLFTHQSFSSGTLGLAYIGSDRDAALGGICSPQQYCSDMQCSINTGWTSFQDSSGNTLITLESHLVTAHELGHNMGSAHDPDTNECSPPAEKDGKYLMYQYSVNGYERNNHFFSPCSRRSIGRALAAKSGKCFEERARSFCGNNRREENEECDAGDVGLTNRHPCCTSDCRLRTGAVCSPSNHACCTLECKASTAGHVCARGDLTSPCEGDARCDGTSTDCPLPQALDLKECGDKGTCRNRTCRPFCESKGQLACQCDKVEESCFVCCRRNSSDACKPASEMYRLKDGRPCVQGLCRAGKCQRRIGNSIERLWIIIKYFNVNEIGRLMWANVVGTVIFLSLIVWIPLSCFVSYFDRVRARSSAQGTL